MQPGALSKADSVILAQVFDPESGSARAEVIADPALPPDKNILDHLVLADVKAREKAAIKLIESFERSNNWGAKQRGHTYREALNLLDSIVGEHPDYASARNNRAQLRRWRFGDRNMICCPGSRNMSHTGEQQSAVGDLQTAIALASPDPAQDAVSTSQGKLLAQAYTQLGALYLRASKDLGDAGDAIDDALQFIDPKFDGWTKDKFEEEASRLFYLGGLYGNEVAKALAVHTNPHAKLCGSIVKEAMRKELATAAV